MAKCAPAGKLSPLSQQKSAAQGDGWNRFVDGCPISWTGVSQCDRCAREKSAACVRRDAVDLVAAGPRAREYERSCRRHSCNIAILVDFSRHHATECGATAVRICCVFPRKAKCAAVACRLLNRTRTHRLHCCEQLEGGSACFGFSFSHLVVTVDDACIRTDDQLHDSDGDGHCDRSARRSAARCHGHRCPASSMMGVQTQVTDSVGLYRFVSIPPGEYKLVFELGRLRDDQPRGRASDRGLHRRRSTRRWESPPSTENVQVTGESPVVDTQSTTINTTFDKETLANLPSARDYWAVLSEAPGVKLARIDVGGSAAGTQTSYFVYGTTGQNRPMVEGINSTESTGSFGNYVDYGSFSGNLDRQRRIERGKPGARRVHRARQQVRRQPLHGLVLRRLRVEGLAVVQHRRRTGGRRRERRRRSAAARRQPAEQLPRSQCGHRRVPEEGHGLVVRIGPKPRLRGPLHELSSQAARNASR